MTGFRLAEIPHDLLKRVTAKVNRRSFIRLRRTCKGMNEFIIAKSSCSEQEWGVFRLVADPNDPSKEPQLSLDRKMMNADTFRASLLDALVINANCYEEIIKYLKDYRFRCKILHTVGEFTKAQLGNVLGLLKPSWVMFNNEGTDKIEVVFPATHLKAIHVDLSSKDVADVTPRLFHKLEDVEMDAKYSSTFNPSDALRSVLMSLLSAPPSLKIFRGTVDFGDQFMPRDDVKCMLGELGLAATDGKPRCLEIPTPSGITWSIYVGHIVRVFYLNENSP